MYENVRNECSEMVKVISHIIVHIEQRTRMGESTFIHTSENVSAENGRRRNQENRGCA